MDMGNLSDGEESFVEFRRRVRSAEVLSSAMERLLQALNFTGRLSVVVQNGRILKSGYEEGYFTRGQSTGRRLDRQDGRGELAAVRN